MQVELSVDQLAVIKSWAEMTQDCGVHLTEWTGEDDQLLSIIEDAIEQAQELQSLDLND